MAPPARWTLLLVALGCALCVAQESQPPLFVCSSDHPPSAGPCATPPKATYSPDPTYSAEAYRARLQGRVRMAVVVTADGRIGDIQVVKSLGMGLDEQAVQAVRQWRFEPATLDGKPVAVKANIEVNFRLYDGRQADKEAAEAAAPDDLPETAGGGSSEANQFFRSGLASYRAKDYEAAATAWKRTVELEPAHLYAWNWLCRADYELKKIEEAIAACRRQIAITPDDHYAHNNLARALWARDKLGEAEAEFRKQIAITPRDRWAHANLGLLLYKQQKCEGAIPELETAYSIDSKNVRARDALRDCYVRTGQSDKAARLTAGAFAAALATPAEGATVHIPPSTDPASVPEADFFSPEIGIRMHLPQGWMVVRELKPSFAQPAQALVLKVGAMATLLLQHEHMESSPQNFLALAKEQLGRNPDFQLLGEGAVSLDGADGDRLLIKFSRDKIQSKGWMEIFSNGDEHYRIVALAPADMFERYAPAYAAMRASVRFAWRHPDEKFVSTMPTPPAPGSGGVLGGIPADTSAGAAPRRVRVGESASQSHLLSSVAPDYPSAAKQAHIQGSVVLAVVIAKTGEIQSVQLVSGHPLLVQAAMDAVKQWRYRPYLLDGEAVIVETQVTVNFELH